MSAAPWSWPDSTITRVIDGDSLVARVTKRTTVTIDVGFHGTVEVEHVATFDQRLRLERINAVPLNKAGGASARATLAGMVLAVPLLITTTKPYKYGDEWMAELDLPDGRNVSDELVRLGHAVYWDGTGPRPGG